MAHGKCFAPRIKYAAKPYKDMISTGKRVCKG